MESVHNQLSSEIDDLTETTRNIFDGKLILGYPSSGKVITGSTTNYVTPNYIPIIGDTKYYCGSKIPVSFHFVDESKQYISNVGGVANAEFTTPQNARYMIFGCKVDGYEENSIIVCLASETNKKFIPHKISKDYIAREKAEESKNIVYNCTNMIETIMEKTRNLTDGIVASGYCSSGKIIQNDTSQTFVSVNPCDVLPNTKYFLKSSGSTTLYFNDENGNYISNIGGIKDVTFTTPQNANKLIYVIKKSDYEENSMMICLNSEDKSYIPHKSAKDYVARELLQKEINRVNEAENLITKLKTNSNIQYVKKEPIVSFTSDDGWKQELTVMKPILNEYGIPCTCALIANNVTDVEERLDLQNNHGWEFASHTVTHSVLTSLTEEEIETELVESKNTLESLGFNIKSIVYPTGASDETVERIARKYYEAGYRYQQGVNIGIIDSFRIYRVPLGAYYNQPNQNTYEFYKSKVDEAIANNGWVIFCMHPYHSDFDDTQKQYLRDLISYVKSKNIKITTLSDGYKIHGNMLEAGYQNGGNSVVIAKDGTCKISNNSEVSKLVTMNTTGVEICGVSKNYVIFDEIISSQGIQPTLTKKMWKLTDLSTDSANPTIIGTAGSVSSTQRNLLCYVSNRKLFVLYSIYGNNYETYFSVKCI